MCSVLFCDLVGFTPLSESRDPEVVRELLSRYFEVARTVIGRYGGVVEKFIGDAVMAVWGTPVATEGDAERAVRAALDLVAAVRPAGGRGGGAGPGGAGGVVTGEVAVTLGAAGEGMVAGDAVNTAARVQSAAEPGAVLVDEATQRLAGSAVGFAEAGEHRLKGKAEPQRLWRATRVLAGVGGVQRVDGLEAPLIGRDAELRTVKELFHADGRAAGAAAGAGVRAGRGGQVAAGLGVREVRRRAGRRRCGGTGAGACPTARGWRSGRWPRSSGSGWASPRKTRPRLPRPSWPRGWRSSFPIRPSGRMWGCGWAGCSASLSRGTPGRRWRGRSCSRGGGCSSSGWPGSRPVVLLVEDAQHADAGLLDFLDHLIDWVRDLPVYVLVFARPELGQTRPGFGAGRNRTTLTLDPLDPASMDQLVDALVPGMPPPARAAVTAQAQGIPLFAVETVRALIDRDIVQPFEGVYRLVGDVGELAVPDSLHALLAARLDALDPDVRRLVADAAVLGTTFPAEALIAVSGQDEPAVRAGLAELLRREVLSVSADPLSPERGSYQFAQNMLRQVAYDTLSRRDRKTRHLAVAAHLRAAFPGDGEEVADVIARHYLDALARRPRRPRRRPDPRPGRQRADPGRRTRRTHRRPRPRRHQLRHRRPARPRRTPRTGS